MCAACWEGGQDFQQGWVVWFEERRRLFPAVAQTLDLSSQTESRADISTFEWQKDAARGSVERWASKHQYSLSRDL